MKRKINAFKIKKSGIYKLRPIFSKATLEPVWDGYGYKLTIRINLLAKILTVLMFPVYVIVEGISEASRDVSDSLKTGDPVSYIYEENHKYFDKAKELYENAVK